MNVEVANDNQINTIPAKQWRAVAWVSEKIRLSTGEHVGPGIVLSKMTYPSREIAEQKTIEWVDHCNFMSDDNGWSAFFKILDPEPVE